MLINPGFTSKRRDDRLPPGQFLARDFPVLSLGVTPHIQPHDWSLTVTGLADAQTWSWDAFAELPHTDMTIDIHCVTRWSKFDTHWEGVSLDTLIELVHVRPEATHLIAHCADGYTTNLPLADVRDGKALVATAYEGEPIADEHGGPARLFVPHLYFWKSAKWLTKLEFVDHDIPGFWETRGYHNYGDPWLAQRYRDD